MNVSGQSVSTPRSKTMTGSDSQACSIAGVNAAVDAGDTIKMSHVPLSTSSAMSAICFSSLPPASSDGERLDLLVEGDFLFHRGETDRRATGCRRQCSRSTTRTGRRRRTRWCRASSGSIDCSQGSPSGPTGSVSRDDSCRLNCSSSNHSDSRPADVPAASPGGVVSVAAAVPATALDARSRRRRRARDAAVPRIAPRTRSPGSGGHGVAPLMMMVGSTAEVFGDDWFGCPAGSLTEHGEGDGENDDDTLHRVAHALD